MRVTGSQRNKQASAPPRAAGKEKTPSWSEPPKEKKLGHFVFSTSKLRSGQQISFGRQFSSGRKFALGLDTCVRPVILVRPDVCVWPGKARLGSKARLASKAPLRVRVSPAEFEKCFTCNTTSHQQTHFPPANRRPASKRVPQTPLATAGGCQRENKQDLTALRRRR